MNFDPNILFFKMVKIFTENKHKKDKVTICNEGGSRCFSGETKVVTIDGERAIKDIQIGDKIKTYNDKLGSIEYKPVVSVLEMLNTKETYCIKLKNKQIIKATSDHKFYYNGKWVELKHLILLWHESKNINKR